MSQRYFSSVKNKTHFLGIAYIDRSMEEEEYGEENPITKKRKTRNKITSEIRKVKFRDDSYTADSKCRFSSIIDEVPLDADALIEAMQNAIKEEANRIPGVDEPKKSKPAPTPAPVVEEDDEDVPFGLNEDEESGMEYDFDAIRTEIRNKNKGGTPEQKKAVKALIAETGVKLDQIEDIEVLTQILEVFE